MKNLSDDHEDCLETYTHKQVLSDLSPSSNQPEKLYFCDEPWLSSEPM